MPGPRIPGPTRWPCWLAVLTSPGGSDKRREREGAVTWLNERTRPWRSSPPSAGRCTTGRTSSSGTARTSPAPGACRSLPDSHTGYDLRARRRTLFRARSLFSSSPMDGIRERDSDAGPRSCRIGAPHSCGVGGPGPAREPHERAPGPVHRLCPDERLRSALVEVGGPPPLRRPEQPGGGDTAAGSTGLAVRGPG